MSDANLFHLRGHMLRVEYNATSVTGQPSLIYTSHGTTRQFDGAALERLDTHAGTLVSVVVELTIDVGSTTLSVLIPRVDVDLGQLAPVATVAVLTQHRLSRLRILGQQEHYSVVHLTGDAQLIQP